MNSPAPTAKPSVEIEAGLSDDERRVPITPGAYDDLDEMIVVDPYNREPSSRKSDKELARVLDILDNLPRGKDAE